MVNGQSDWIDYRDVVLDDRDFGQIGKTLDRQDSVTIGYVGNAKSRLIPLVQAVEHAKDWMALHRTQPRSPAG
jgi:aminoglycoside 3-N-acetyltransferase